MTLKPEEFVRRFLMHVLPKGFQKIRYYGLLNNRMKKKNLETVRRLQDGPVKYTCKYAGLSGPELVKALYGIDVTVCPVCNKPGMKFQNPWHNRRRKTG